MESKFQPVPPKLLADKAAAELDRLLELYDNDHKAIAADAGLSSHVTIAKWIDAGAISAKGAVMVAKSPKAKKAGFTVETMRPTNIKESAQYKELERLQEHCGGFRSNIARAAGVTPQAVAKWFERGYISAVSATVIADIDKFKAAGFTRQSLRPDVDVWVK